MRWRNNLWLFTLLLAAARSAAQDFIPRFEAISVNEGLSQNTVNSIFQDSKGYLWLGTGDGLNRYDGDNVKVFRIPDNTNVPANPNTIRSSFCEDKRGNIWFTTETGLYYVSNAAGRIIPALIWSSRDDLKQYVMHEVVYLDDSDHLYLYNYTGGFLQYNVVSRQIKYYTLTTRAQYTQPIASFVVYNNGKLWFRRQSNDGAYSFDLHDKQVKHYFGNKNVVHICFGKKNNYLVFSHKVYLTDTAFQYRDSLVLAGLKDSYVCRAVFEDAYGRPWIATYGMGLLLYDFDTKKLAGYKGDRTAVSLDFPITMYNDRNNNLWIGTDGNGVCRLNIKPGKFNKFPFNKNDYPQLKNWFIRCLYEDSKGQIWFGTHGDGLYCFNKDKNTLSAFPVCGKTAGAVFCDKAGNIWAGGSAGIFILKNGRFRKIEVKGAAPVPGWNSFVNKFLQLHSGVILAATAQGLVRIDATKKGFVAQLVETGCPGQKLGDIAEMAGNDVWVSGYGVYRLDASAGYKMKQRYLQGLGIRGLHRDDNDPRMLWIATAKGLVRLDIATGGIRIYNDADGLANNSVYCILEDSVRRLWISTNGGISCLDRKSGRFQNYTVKDGLQSNEFNSGACCKTNKGILYFGGINGFNWFHPSMPVYNIAPPLLDITQVSIDDTAIGNKEIAADSVIEMRYGKKSISFSFAVLDYTLPGANTIAYSLAGGGDKWYRSYDKVVRYANLSPGTYTLNVKAVNSYGVESPVKTIRFRVLPPFWKTDWFLFSIAVMVVLASTLFTRYVAQRKLKARVAELEKQKEIDKERMRISREMHDDIGAGLTQITLMSEMAKSKMGIHDRKELLDIADTSRRLVNNMSEIIWSLNPGGRSLDQLFSYLRENLNKLLEYSGIEYFIDFPELAPDIYLTDEQRRNILLIVKEAVNNAVKYSKATRLSIIATVKGTMLLCRVEDNGIGFDEAGIQAGNGLINMRKRASDLNGIIRIDSEKLMGTIVNVSIPLKSHSFSGI